MAMNLRWFTLTGALNLLLLASPAHAREQIERPTEQLLVVLVGILLLVIATLLWYLLSLRKNSRLQREQELDTNVSWATEENEERYRGIVESLAEGVVIQTQDNKVVTANLSASTILGVTPEYLQNKPLTDPSWRFVHEDGSELQAGEHPIRRTLDSGQPVQKLLLGYHDGRQHDTRWISFNTRPLSKAGQAQPYAAVASFQDITTLKRSLAALNRKNQLLDVLSQVQAKFIIQKEESEAFDLMLEGLLTLTGSEYGFIGKTLIDEAGSRYLKTYAITNIAWNEETQALYDAQASQGMEFRNLNTLFGYTIATGEATVSNDPANDPRSGGTPHGHPPLKSFLGLPIHMGDKLVGMAGIANRRQGYDDDIIAELEPFLRTGANLIEALENRRKHNLAQQALQNSELRLRSVLDNAVDSIITIDAAGIIKSFNRASETIFDYRADEVVGCNVNMLMPEALSKAHDNFLAAHQRQASGKKTNILLEVTGRRRDGSEFPIEITVGEIEIQGQTLFTGILREVSERKRMEAELEVHRNGLETLVQERTTELNAANEEIRQFAYIVSHDLRAPLVNIKGFTKELQHSLEELNSLLGPLLAQLNAQEGETYERITRTDIPEAMEFIESSASKMDHQINAILKLSRTGRREFIPMELDMEALAQRVLKTMRHQIEMAGIEVSVARLPRIFADPNALEQIISNLIDNAIKYLRPGVTGHIDIRGTENVQDYSFTVCDNGRGIEERDLDRIFSIFQRVGAQDQPGDGMGLTYVQALLRGIGGRIWCESQPDQGSCFHFTIPKADGTTAARSHQIAAEGSGTDST